MTTNRMKSSAALCVLNGHTQKSKEVEERGHWGTKAEFILTVMGAIIGPGNIWRFPYLCYKNGGGERFYAQVALQLSGSSAAFLPCLLTAVIFCFVLFFIGVFFIPYTVFIFTCGIPLFFLETALGQYTSQGGITCWRTICPLFQGKTRGTILMFL